MGWGEDFGVVEGFAVEVVGLWCCSSRRGSGEAGEEVGESVRGVEATRRLGGVGEGTEGRHMRVCGLAVQLRPRVPSFRLGQSLGKPTGLSLWCYGR